MEPTKIPCLAQGISAGRWVDLEEAWALAAGSRPAPTCKRSWSADGGHRRDFMVGCPLAVAAVLSCTVQAGRWVAPHLAVRTLFDCCRWTSRVTQPVQRNPLWPASWLPAVDKSRGSCTVTRSWTHACVVNITSTPQPPKPPQPPQLSQSTNTQGTPVFARASSFVCCSGSHHVQCWTRWRREAAQGSSTPRIPATCTLDGANGDGGGPPPQPPALDNTNHHHTTPTTTHHQPPPPRRLFRSRVIVVQRAGLGS